MSIDGYDTPRCMAEIGPFVLAQFDWSENELVLRFMKRASWGGPMPGESTVDPREAYRWASRQAARQYLVRSEHLIGPWEVLDLRQVRWQDRR